MGSGSSKAARAAGSAARKYPSRQATQNPAVLREQATAQASVQSAHPAVNASAPASSSKSEAIDLDGRDPQFADRLAQLGPVKPAPTYSPSATTKSPEPSPASARQERDGASARPMYPSAKTNPALAIVEARQRLQEAADQEKMNAAKPGFVGHEHLDIVTLRKALALRDESGMNLAKIEETLRLKKGTMNRLGRIGVVEVA